MLEGQWLFHRLGPAFVDELVRRCQETLGVERERLVALPSYRLAALALNGVDRDVALVGSDGPSTLLDLSGANTQPPDFWRALLRSFNGNDCFADARPVDYCQPTAAHHQALDAALAVLKDRAPHTHAALTGWIPRILVVQGVPQSGSSPRFFGCILMPAEAFETAPIVLAADLVHELAHQELFVLNAYDRLVSPHADETWRFSVFAGFARPTMGRLHASHALFRMIQLCRQTGTGAFIRRGKLWRTLRSFRRGELTPMGQLIVRDVYPGA
jgi:HEXXH motif-containing protein